MARNRLRGADAAAVSEFQNDPICLSASGVVTPLQPLQIGAVALQANFLRQPIELTELRFLIVMENAFGNGSANYNFQPTPAAYIRLQARAGRWSMTHSTALPGVGSGLVPIGCLTPRINAAAEYGFFPGSFTVATGIGSPASYCVWKFDRPLALPLGVAPELMFQYVPPGPATLPGLAATRPIQIYVSAVGRMIGEMPKTQHVPYAAAWVPQSGAQDTSENDFRNLTGRTVRFRKIVSRPYQLVTSTAGETFWQEFCRQDPNSAINETAGTDYSKTAKLQIFDDMGRGMQREPVRYGSLFPEDTLTLPFHYDLEHGKKIAVSYAGQNIPSNTTWMPCYAMLGSREESAW